MTSRASALRSLAGLGPRTGRFQRRSGWLGSCGTLPCYTCPVADWETVMANEFRTLDAHSAEYFGDTRSYWWNRDFLELM